MKLTFLQNWKKITVCEKVKWNFRQITINYKKYHFFLFMVQIGSNSNLTCPIHIWRPSLSLKDLSQKMQKNGIFCKKMCILGNIFFYQNVKCYTSKEAHWAPLQESVKVFEKYWKMTELEPKKRSKNAYFLRKWTNLLEKSENLSNFFFVKKTS